MAEQERWLIVGLGNPGRRYAKNRHNIGFQCLDQLARAHELAFDKRQAKGRLAMGVINGRSAILLKPQAFMNESGRSVAAIARFYRVSLERMLVIYDELDIPLGSVRLRSKGGSGGHKGMRSIITHLGDENFPRLRVGVGRPPGRLEPADFVLQDFSEEELAVTGEIYDWAVQAIECWLTDGVEIAMTRFNRNLCEEDA